MWIVKQLEELFSGNLQHIIHIRTHCLTLSLYSSPSIEYQKFLPTTKKKTLIFCHDKYLKKIAILTFSLIYIYHYLQHSQDGT